mmetsp:Transcript_29462/g.73947  ORF Transcript_29462/g.73947 Transcript_29462/m.73947 type:complete len:485 (-) Transcript_29462:693-2147(-)
MQHVVAVSALTGVAVGAHVAVLVDPYVQTERSQGEAAHQPAIHKAVHDGLLGEDAVGHRGALHQVRRAVVHGDTDGGAGARGSVDEQDRNGAEHENGVPLAVNDEAQGEHEHHGLGHVSAQQVHHEVADGCEDTAALLHSGHDGGEVVVCQHNVRNALGDVRAGDAHGNANVGLLDGGRVVDAITRHGHNLAPAVQCLHHAHLALRGAARHDQRQVIELVKLLICHGVHLGSSGDGALGGLALGNNANLLGNSPCRRRVIAGEHTDDDAGGEAMRDGRYGRLLGRVTDRAEREQTEVVLDLVTLHGGDVGALRGQVHVGALRDSQHAQAIGSEIVHNLHQVGAGVGMVAAAGQDGLRRTLHGHQARAALSMEPAGAHGLGHGVKVKGAAHLVALLGGVYVGHDIFHAVGDLPCHLHHCQLGGRAVALQVVGILTANLHHAGATAQHERAQGVAHGGGALALQGSQRGGPLSLAAVSRALRRERV